MIFPSNVDEYPNLKTFTDDLSIIYGPYKENLPNQSLGLNLFGPFQKICSFSCPYCSLGPTQIRINQIKKITNLPSCDDIRKEVRTAFQDIVGGGIVVDRLVISGLGEPTLHPQFSEIVDAVIALRAELIPDLPIAIYSNGAHLTDKKILRALNKIDQKIIKMDAGNDEMFELINAPLVRSNLSKIITSARKVENVMVQSFFSQGRIDNTTPDHISDWVEVIGMIAPTEVHISSLTHIPDEAGLIRPEPDVLHSIGCILKRKIQIECKVFT